MKPKIYQCDGTCPITGVRFESFSQITNNIKQLEDERRKRAKKVTKKNDATLFIQDEKGFDEKLF